MIDGYYIVKVIEAHRHRYDPRAKALDVDLYTKCIKCDAKQNKFQTIEKCTRFVVGCKKCGAKPHGFSIEELLHRHLKDVATVNRNADPQVVQAHLTHWDGVFGDCLLGYTRIHT